MAVKLRYTKPPLPFIGNKSKWVGMFAETVSALPPSTVFVDCFGGSGLLSRTAADACPGSRVIYNDFDGYADRVAQIPVTNAVLAELRGLLSAYPREAKIPAGVKAEGLRVIQSYRDLFGGIDEATVTANVAFSSRSIEGGTAEKMTWYNRLRLSDIPEAPDYLDGLEVVRADFRELFARFGDDPRAVFILDPPYLSTRCDAYSAYGGLVDTLDLLKCIVGKRYVFFTSDSSELDKPVRWLAENVSPDYDVLIGSTKQSRKSVVATTKVGKAEWVDSIYIKV